MAKENKPPQAIVAILKALESQQIDSKVFSPSDQTLLNYSLKLTESPGAITATDVDALTTAGFSDQAIHDAACIVGYFAFVNRVADGLGVQLES